MLREHYITGERAGSKSGQVYYCRGRVEDPMAAWTGKLVSDLDKADAAARQLIEGLSTEQLNWRPAPESWSVGQCLDHLRAMNDVYLPPMARALDGKPKGTTDEIRPGLFGSFFLKNFVEPSEKSKKVKAPKKIAPAPQVDGNVLAELLAGNENMRRLIERADEYDVNRIRFRNPFIPLIRFTVGTGLTIVVRHQHRHLLQAERVRAAAGFPQ